LYNKRNLIDFCLAESSNFISVQKYQLAIPAASQALKFSRELDGDTSILLVEPYLQLALASFGLNRLKECEEYLALAQWIVLNTEDCSDLTKSRLFQLLGRLSFSRSNYEKAKSEFSKAVYYSSRVYGAESVSTSIGYFRLGEVFLSLGNSESAFSFFDKVVDIWHKYLSLLLSRLENTETEETQSPEQINEENLSDGRSQLQKVFEHRQEVLGVNHIATGEAQFTMGLFEYFLLGNQTSAEALLSSALTVYNMQLGVEHASSKHVSSILALVKNSVDDTRAEVSQFASLQEFEDPNTVTIPAAPED